MINDFLLETLDRRLNVSLAVFVNYIMNTHCEAIRKRKFVAPNF
jgi:hypothetical protein